MLNEKCKFLPCHKGIENCDFCFCIIHPCGNLKYGKWLIYKESAYKSRKVWNCIDCIFFHKKDNVEKVKDFMRKMINEEKTR